MNEINWSSAYAVNSFKSDLSLFELFIESLFQDLSYTGFDSVIWLIMAFNS